MLEEEAYSGFKLKALFEVTAEVEKNDLLKNSSWKELLSEMAEVFENEDGEVWLFGDYEEAAAYDVEKTADRFLMPFVKEVEKINTENIKVRAVTKY